MAKNKFTVEQVPGSSRASDRIYTHAIIARFDRDAYLAALQQRLADLEKSLRNNWRYTKHHAAATHGDIYPEPGYSFEMRQESIDKARQEMAEVGGTWEGYLAKYQKQETERTHQRLAADDGLFYVLQWSMSHANACKGTSKFTTYGFHKDIQVVPVTQVK